MSYETRYAAAMRQRADRAASTPEAAAARIKMQDALARARADRQARYPKIHEGNIAAALEYQEERIRYWRDAIEPSTEPRS